MNSSVLITPEASTTRLKSTDDSDLAVEPPQGDCQVAHSPREHFPQPAVIVPAKFEPLVGPLSPAPNLTLAELVLRVASRSEQITTTTTTTTGDTDDQYNEQTSMGRSPRRGQVGLAKGGGSGHPRSDGQQNASGVRLDGRREDAQGLTPSAGGTYPSQVPPAPLQVDLICGAKAHSCMCGLPVDHVGAHECQRDGGQWIGTIGCDDFEAVRFPDPFWQPEATS